MEAGSRVCVRLGQVQVAAFSFRLLPRLFSTFCFRSSSCEQLLGSRLGCSLRGRSRSLGRTRCRRRRLALPLFSVPPLLHPLIYSPPHRSGYLAHVRSRLSSACLPSRRTARSKRAPSRARRTSPASPSSLSPASSKSTSRPSGRSSSTRQTGKAKTISGSNRNSTSGEYGRATLTAKVASAASSRRGSRVSILREAVLRCKEYSLFLLRGPPCLVPPPHRH